ncbi:Inner membrane protein YohD [Roseivivax sp. THAF40]|uniref:DedA family protein n=1 Tax=unclassified Roseivivax TaxID=2639302 RepID=UPI0012AA71EF|nr:MULTISPECIES: VTT domain-containing protein [unclassified Roseivivax]QFS83847.1 Inner membrane protein YohD [Roseivivax sp. THAF197b]QFT47679.1 Inner membrane protein YohD [Roseivivax sp. THAF40]
MDAYIAQYGVFAVYIGCALEGDAAAISGAILAQSGLLDPVSTYLAIAAGAYTTDFLVYTLARFFREHPYVLRALSHPMAARLTGRLLSRPLLLAAIFRFIPGARTIAPVMLATATPLRPTVYFIVTACAALVWAGVMLAVGFGAGAVLSRLLGPFLRLETLLIGMAALLILVAARVLWRLRQPR